MYQPLADALRPQTLDDVCGQSHILGENGLLRRIIDSGTIPNMIFYGPSGTGQDDGCKHHRQPHAPKALQAKRHDGLLRRYQGDLRAARYLFSAERGASVSRRDSVLQQKAAADASRIHRKRQDHPYRVYDRKPVFLCVQRDFVPVDGL